MTAAVIIVFVNILGGLTIGVLQQGMSPGLAAQTYTLLTVGEGLVAQPDHVHLTAEPCKNGSDLIFPNAGKTIAPPQALLKFECFEPRNLRILNGPFCARPKGHTKSGSPCASNPVTMKGVMPALVPT